MATYTVRTLTEDFEVEEVRTFANILDAEDTYFACVDWYTDEPEIYSVQLFNTETGSMIYETYCG